MSETRRPAPQPRPSPGRPRRPSSGTPTPAQAPSVPPPVIAQPPVRTPPPPPPPRERTAPPPVRTPPPPPPPRERTAPPPIPKVVLPPPAADEPALQLTAPGQPPSSLAVDEPEPPHLPAARSRAQRLRAERKARKIRLQRVLQIAGGALAVVVVVSVVLAVTSGGGGPAHSASPTPRPSATGANLQFPLAATAFLGSAASDLAAITTYDYRHLDDALSAGLAVTTGKYHEQYQLALTGDLARTATAEHVVHTFEVLDVGIGAMTANGAQAKVLVFGRERVTDNTTGPDGRVTPITLTATINRIGNRYLVSALAQSVDPGLPPGGPDLTVAVDAARNEVVNTLSYRRSDFPADLQHAVEGAASPLSEQLQSDAPNVRDAMIAGKYDTTGTVTATAVVRADPDTVTLLIAADESQAVDDASEPTVISHRYEVTVTRTESGWLVSRISSVDGGV